MVDWYDLRVFSRDGQGGNPLAVVLEPVEDMASLARTIGYSETIFLGEEPISRLVARKARIFSPAGELQFAGHPLVGAAWLGEELTGRPVGRFELPGGEVEVWRVGERAYFRTDVPEVTAEPGDVFTIVEALGADPLDLTPRIPVAVSGLSLRWTIVPFAEPDRVLDLKPDLGTVKKVADAGLYCFALRGNEVTARCFAPQLGIDEDPGTGSGALALAAYLIRYGRRLRSEFMINQTHCRIHVSIGDRGICVGGEVVLVGVCS